MGTVEVQYRPRVDTGNHMTRFRQGIDRSILQFPGRVHRDFGWVHRRPSSEQRGDAFRLLGLASKCKFREKLHIQVILGDI